MRVATEKGIPSKDRRKSENARVMMYKLVTDLPRDGFLIAAIPSRRLPAKEVRLIRSITKDSTNRIAVVRLCNCWENTSVLVNVTFIAFPERSMLRGVCLRERAS